ncbi:hypothetical protein BT93_G0592 [Corymbia citriodora subsp. variegata]|nr:hypothetical protein BT93_G0592 [Corymbia citriodora subsp. variegata]
MKYQVLTRKRERERESVSFIKRGEQVRVRERWDVADSKAKSHRRRLGCYACREREAAEESCCSDARMPAVLL